MVASKGHGHDGCILRRRTHLTDAGGATRWKQVHLVGKNFTLTCGEIFPPPQFWHKKNTRQPEILHHFHFQARKLDLEVRIKTNLMPQLAKAETKQT